MPIESKRRAIKQRDSCDFVNNHAEKLISLKRDNSNGFHVSIGTNIAVFYER